MPAKTRPDSTVQPEPGDNTKYLTHNMRLWKLEKPDMTDYDAVESRIYEYFDICAQDDMKPSVAGLALAFGVNRSTLWKWANGQGQVGRNTTSPSIGNLLKKAYAALNAQMEDYMQNNRVNAVAGIFLMKNHFGYEDKTEVIVQPGPYDALPDADKLAQEYIDAVTVPAKELTEKSSQNNAENAESVDNLAQEYTVNNS